MCGKMTPHVVRPSIIAGFILRGLFASRNYVNLPFMRTRMPDTIEKKETTSVRLTQGTLASIELLLEARETKIDFIRTAVRNEIRNRRRRRPQPLTRLSGPAGTLP
jgi:hypothetical protein